MKLSLTESQLRDIIMEEIANTMMDEGLFGGRLSNAWNQNIQSLKSGYYDNRANNMAQKIEQQIQKSQEVIRGEQNKINQLRNQYNTYVTKSGDALAQANKYAAQNGKFGQNGNFYDDTRMQQNRNTTTQDFYNQADLDSATNSARMSERGRFGNKVRNGQYVRQNHQTVQEAIDRVTAQIFNEIRKI